MSGTLGPASGYLAGLATLTINGEPYDIVSDLEWRPSGVHLTTLSGQTRVEGPQAMPMAGFISAVVRDNVGFTITQFVGATAVSAQAFQANGKSISLSNGWVVGEIGPVRTQEGTFAIRIESANVVESLQ